MTKAIAIATWGWTTGVAFALTIATYTNDKPWLFFAIASVLFLGITVSLVLCHD